MNPWLTPMISFGHRFHADAPNKLMSAHLKSCAVLIQRRSTSRSNEISRGRRRCLSRLSVRCGARRAARLLIANRRRVARGRRPGWRLSTSSRVRATRRCERGLSENPSARKVAARLRRPSWLQLKLVGLHEADRSDPRSRLQQVDHDVDVAACGFGIRARLMRGIHQGLDYVALDAWHPDVETSLEEIGSVG
jgi:hypothetical protein